MEIREKMRFLQISMLLLILIMSVIFIPAISQAANCTQYVSTKGSASWANATNIGTPASATTAFAKAIADNVVCFRAGTYSTTRNPDGNGDLRPANSGTSGHPITFQAYPGETVIFNSFSDTMPGSRAIGVLKSYVTLDGFTFIADGGTKKGGILIQGETTYVTGDIVKNCVFNGGTNTPTWTDNSEGLRIENTSYTTAQNNVFYSYKEANNCPNTSAIKTYHNDYLTITNNEIHNCTNGIFLKSDTNDSTISYNWIHNNYTGSMTAIYYTALAHNSDRLIWHDNVFANNSANMGMDQDDGAGEHADDWQIYNNTIYGNSSAAGIEWMRTSTLANGPKVYNNILYGIVGGSYAHSQLMSHGSSAGTVGLVEEDHNQLGTSSVYIVMSLYSNSRIYVDLSLWQASTELASGGHPGTGDLISNPLFVNSSGNYSQLSDFNLQSGSPCKGTGRGGVDMGANIAIVGTGRPPLKVLSPPPNVR